MIKFKDEQRERSQQFDTVISKPQVHLNYQKWDKNQMGQVSKDIEEWSIQKIWLEDNKKSSILKEILNIKFQNLKLMCLYRNNISSFQGLCQIYMPRMQSLGLGGNNSVNFKQLRKCYWVDLDSLYLGKYKTNIEFLYLQQCNFLTQMVHNKYEILNINHKEEKKVKVEDLCVLAKLKIKSDEFRRLAKDNANRIVQSKFEKLLSNKYPKIYFS